MGAEELPEEPGRVEGQVLDATTGRPISGAYVSFKVAGSKEIGFFYHAKAPSRDGGRTDAQGKFSALVPPAYYRPLADKEGYVDGPSESFTIIVEPGQTISGLTLTLQAAGSFSGHVRDEQGQPLADAYVQVFSWENTFGPLRLQRVTLTSSRLDGSYCFTGLPPTRYVVSAQLLDADRRTISLFTADYAPPAATLVPGHGLDLTSGVQLTGVDLFPRPVSGVRLEGCVTGFLRHSFSVILQLIPQPEPFALDADNYQLTLNNEGPFDVSGVPPGRYRLLAYQLSPQGGHLLGFASLDLEVDTQDVIGLELPLAPGEVLRGTVHGSAPVTAAFNLLLHAPAEAVETHARVPAHGDFALPHVIPARYFLSISHLPPGFSVQSVRFAGQDLDPHKSIYLDCTRGLPHDFAITLAGPLP